MTIQEAIELFKKHQKSAVKKNTLNPKNAFEISIPIE